MNVFLSLKHRAYLMLEMLLKWLDNCEVIWNTSGLYHWQVCGEAHSLLSGDLNVIGKGVYRLHNNGERR